METSLNNLVPKQTQMEPTQKLGVSQEEVKKMRSSIQEQLAHVPADSIEGHCNQIRELAKTGVILFYTPDESKLTGVFSNFYEFKDLKKPFSISFGDPAKEFCFGRGRLPG